MNEFTHPRGARAMAAVMIGGLFSVAGMAVPAKAASTTIHYSYIDPPATQILPCGAVWTFSGDHKGTIIKPDGEGGYFKVIQHDYYPGTITYAGRTYTANDHQTDISYVKDGPAKAPHNPGAGDEQKPDLRAAAQRRPEGHPDRWPGPVADRKGQTGGVHK